MRVAGHVRAGRICRNHRFDLPMQTGTAKADATRKGLIYRTRVELDARQFVADGKRHSCRSHQFEKTSSGDCHID